MSNPAVVVLSSGRIGKSNVTIEDNVGEAIHLHMDDIRIDFTYLDFKKMVEGTKKVIEEIVSVEGFSCDDYDPVFLSSIAPWLLDLERVEEDTISLEDILVNIPKKYKHVNFESIKSSKDYKAMQGDCKEISKYNSFDHIGQTGIERLNDIVESIKEYGYPFKNKRMVFFNDSNVIRDGQHRAAVLRYLYGSREVPILRLYFRGDKYSYPALQKKHRRKLRDRQYLVRYIKDRVLQVLRARNNRKTTNWKLKNKELVENYDEIDK